MIIDNKEYLTVKEFAEAASVSNKAIYQQLKTRLKDYQRYISGAIYINTEALEIFFNGNNNIQVSQVKSSQVESSLESDINNKYTDYLEKENERLRKQIDDKDIIILELQKQVIELSNNISNMAQDNIQQIATITKNIQWLQAADTHNRMISNDNSNEDIIPKEKKSFWYKILGK